MIDQSERDRRRLAKLTRDNSAPARYQLTRRAHNASWSDRTAKIGKPYATLKAALDAARYYTAAKGGEVTIRDTVLNRRGTVAQGGIYRLGSSSMEPRITFSLPPEWAECIDVHL